MAAPDLPVLLDEALRGLDSLHENLRGVQTLRQFLDALDEMQQPADPLRMVVPLGEYVAMEHAYDLGARCVTVDGNLIVITRTALVGLLRRLGGIEL